MENTMSNTANQLVILATARALPGQEAKLAAALRDVAAPTRAQPGCLGFELLISEDRSTITAIERWASKEDHGRHLQGAHVKALIGKFDGVLAAAPDIVALKPL
jgi:quinol monooxygenase YgiN